MVYFERWKVILILLACFLGLAYAAPNLTGQNWHQALPSWMPGKTINLGLDLQGGSHILLRIEMDQVFNERRDSMIDEARRNLRRDRIGYSRLAAIPNGLQATLRDTAQADQAVRVLRDLDDGLDIDRNDANITVTFSEDKIEEMRRQTLAQSIEIVRRRVDETGTREPMIQAQGADRVLVQLPGVDDPDAIKQLLGQTARLTFNLEDQENSVSEAMSGRVPAGSMLLPFIDSGAQAGQKILVQRRAIITGEMLVNAQPTFQDGQPVVSFKFDAVGARRFCEVTTRNVGRPFAIILDDEVISAPVIRDAICGGSGIISGSFTVQTANNLALLLRAGALPAPLVVIEERSVGPSLGADSIEAGKAASMVAILAVLIFMMASYGLFGIMASVALVMNMAFIFALLSTLQATLTLPGIAGIVLTIGMAVDANVLIFERIREEFRAGRSLISAIDAGYARAMTTIVDSNLTTLIAAVLLYSFGSGPIKGFAVTLGVGIVTSMFSAIMVTRLMVVAWLRKTKSKTLPM